MGILNVNDLRPGMVLAEPVMNFRGGKLLDKGTALTDKHINMMKAWGITGADIIGEMKAEKDAAADLDEKAKLEIEAKIREKFPYEQLDPVNKELKNIVKKILVKSYKH